MSLPRLIASDIDGTLIPYGQTELPPGLFDAVTRLEERGVVFCPASGRQYHSLRRLFAPVARRLCFICENGAVVFGREQGGRAPVLSKTVMPRADALALAEDILACPGIDALLSGEDTSYVCGGGSPDLARDLRERLGNRVTSVGAPGEIDEEIIKVSAFCPRGTAPATDALGPRWGERYNMAVAGPQWVDFTLANKGTGLGGLCAALGVATGDVMAFGDNWNDVSMLTLAGRPWLMASAEPRLRARFPNQCTGVMEVLEELLAQA